MSLWAEKTVMESCRLNARGDRALVDGSLSWNRKPPPGVCLEPSSQSLTCSPSQSMHLFIHSFAAALLNGHCAFAQRLPLTHVCNASPLRILHDNDGNS